MTHITLADAPATRPAPKPRLGLWARLCRHVARVDAAHARLARFQPVTSDVVRDTSLSPEEIVGEPTYDPALPFFMQAGFGQRD